jgi:hypothetical protein
MAKAEADAELTRLERAERAHHRGCGTTSVSLPVITAHLQVTTRRVPASAAADVRRQLG